MWKYAKHSQDHHNRVNWYNNDQMKVVEWIKAENRRSDTFKTTKVHNEVQKKVDNDPTNTSTNLVKEMGASLRPRILKDVKESPWVG